MRKIKKASPRSSGTKASNLKPNIARRATETHQTGVSRARGMTARVQKVFAEASTLQERIEQLHGTVEQPQPHEMAHSVKQTARHQPAQGSDNPPAEKVTEEVVSDDRPKRKAKPFPIVGVGASAGGLEALLEFVNQLPQELGMAFVLVQHLDPKHKSNLTPLLARRSKLEVIEARNEMEVQADHIYVIPENVSITLNEGRLRLAPRKTGDKRDIPPMPIDIFFRSLASEQQDRAIGVVLSGTGTDGTAGLEAIKGEGGISFAQDEQSSKYFGMPSSAIGSGVVDFVLPPGQIARELVRLSLHPYVGRAGRSAIKQELPSEKMLQETGEPLDRIFRILRSRVGVDFALYKQSTLKRRILRRMILQRVDKLSEYLAKLEANPAEIDALFADLLINVTGFFRDPEAFKILKKNIFPRILKSHRNDTPVRMWACGCATGEEAYSLAISISEFLEKNRDDRRVQIFATDLSHSSIERARTGIYRQNIAQDVSPERLRRFFTKVNGEYQLQKHIRDMCIFARQNVMLDPPFSNLDLVTCRNVLIYFGPILQRKIIPLFHYALRPNGFLMLGSSESIGPSEEQFKLVERRHKIYQKRHFYMQPHPEARQKFPSAWHPGPPAGPEEAPPARPMDLQQIVDRTLLRDYSPPAVVVNSDLQAVLFRGRTGDYLEHASGLATLNILKMARDDIITGLRAALNKAMRTEKPVSQAGLELKRGARLHHLSIEVIPLTVGSSIERYYLVLFKQVALPTEPIRGTHHGRKSRELQENQRLKDELQATKDTLESIIEEQEATNEELKSANEEIQSSNEELQSTNEELETAKEELQSTNEELITLNEELNNSNAEMNQANNDLNNLLTSVHMPILMLGPDLTLRRFTPMAERLFELVPADAGRRLSEANRTMLLPDLEQTITEVIDSLAPVEREIRDREGHWHLLRIRPYRTRDNKIDGAVLVLVDIDEVRHALDLFMNTLSYPLLMLGEDLKVRNANRAFENAFHLPPASVINHILYEVGDGQFNNPDIRRALEEVLPQNKPVRNFELEAEFPEIGRRKLQMNATRLSEKGQALKMILMAIEDITRRSG